MADLDLATWWRHSHEAYEHRTWRDYRLVLAEVIRHAPQPPLLDVGCGFGFVVECARQFGVAATGVDGAAHALAEGRKRHPLADLRDWTAGTPLDFAAASFGAVLLSQVVDHFTLDENRLLFAEIHRLLAPGGVVLVYSPSRFNTLDNDPGHVTFFSPSEFRDFVESHGFRVRRQPYHALPVFGTSKAGQLLVRGLAQLVKPERFAATIDLIAEKV